MAVVLYPGPNERGEKVEPVALYISSITVYITGLKLLT